jgi:hypothetical protein
VVLPNDGAPLAYEQGAAVTLHLPSDALRVLRESAAPAEPEPAPEPEPEPETEPAAEQEPPEEREKETPDGN